MLRLLRNCLVLIDFSEEIGEGTVLFAGGVMIEKSEDELIGTIFGAVDFSGFGVTAHIGLNDLSSMTCGFG